MGSCDVLALYFRLTGCEHRGASAIHQSNIPALNVVVYSIFLNKQCVEVIGERARRYLVMFMEARDIYI